MLDFSKIDVEAFRKDMARRAEEGRKRVALLRTAYTEKAILPSNFGKRIGPFHAASILSWVRIAELAGVPHIPAKRLAYIPIDDAWRSIESEPISSESEIELAKIQQYADGGGVWRTDLCASSDVKQSLSEGMGMPKVIPFYLDDTRIMDIHHTLPGITVVERPTIVPTKIGAYPVEFRVFIGGRIESSDAVSFYYPQAPDFEITSELLGLMDLSVDYAHRVNNKRIQLGLLPWLPELGDPDIPIGCTIDFIVTESGDLLMVDAGPGFGYGAHPCCFIDIPVVGKRWRPAEGVTIR
jgi:hypothetical protein